MKTSKLVLPKNRSDAKRAVCTGSAGALARYEREARNNRSVKDSGIEHARRARHAGEGARAPSISLPPPATEHFLGKTDRMGL